MLRMRGHLVRESTGACMARSFAFGMRCWRCPMRRRWPFHWWTWATRSTRRPGRELQAADTQDLQHQLQLVNGPLVAPPGGWAFQPRVDAQSLLTDNIYQVNAPRQWDLVTYLAPGFTIAADKPRLPGSLVPTFQPDADDACRSRASLNSLTQQYTGSATATLVEDLLFLDVRAISGVNSLYGGLGGIGGIGSGSGNGTTAATVNGTGGVLRAEQK